MVGSSQQAAYGSFPVPAEPGTYTLDVAGKRQVSWSVLGTEVTGSWTFQSAAAGNPGLHPLPLMLIHASARLDPHNSAPAGVPYLLGLEVQRQVGAAVAPLTRLKLEVSYDDGATWRQAPVAFLGNRGLALLFHPQEPGFVSLRSSARDAAANAVTHTVIRAYRTRAQVPPDPE